MLFILKVFLGNTFLFSDTFILDILVREEDKKLKKAIIDVGTNSLRLLIAKILDNSTCSPLFYRVEITRLGEGMGQEGKLSSKAIKRTIGVIQSYLRDIEEWGGEKVFITATSAVREAVNGEYFVSRVKEETGLYIKVLSGTEEAELSYLGVIKTLPENGENPLVFDLGGGSTEFIWRKGNEIFSESYKVGVVRLTEKYISSDPPRQEELFQMEEHIKKTLKEMSRDKVNEQDKLVGVGGTITSLAAMNQELKVYQQEKVHGYVLSRENLAKQLNRLLLIKEPERKKLPGLQPQRADVIIAGTAAIITIMDLFNYREVTASEGDLLIGAMYYFS